MASSVNGSNHGNGPTFDCHTKLCALHLFSSFITNSTEALTSDGYASPLLTAYKNAQNSFYLPHTLVKVKGNCLGPITHFQWQRMR